MVVVMVVYDISDDEVRNLVANKLLKMGFTRIQKSVYVRRGTLGTSRYVFRSLSRIIDPLRDRLLVLSISDRDYISSLSIGPKAIGDTHGGNILL